MAETEDSGRKKWFPLESNPDVMNAYVQSLGLDVTQYSFHDVLSVEEWALDMVPKPVKAVVFLYPISAVQETHREEESARIEGEGQTVSDKVYYMRQYVGNACGTVGILHALCNAKDTLPIESGSYVERFYETTKSMTPHDIAVYLEGDEEIEQSHGAAADQGQSEQKDLEESVDTHFVCFSCVDGHLYELDGRKKFPINHGPCTEEELLPRSAEVIQQFMQRDPAEMRFTITALAANAED